ncbi:hypothetical protein ABTX77_19390 [Streptomyces sp. NPDC097704]|uniref:hypothetical protein n=1 Tax=Streptomyces sp. NPDC097704 TaxID=3157101 RepID=UPI0033339963
MAADGDVVGAQVGTILVVVPDQLGIADLLVVDGRLVVGHSLVSLVNVVKGWLAHRPSSGCP